MHSQFIEWWNIIVQKNPMKTNYKSSNLPQKSQIQCDNHNNKNKVLHCRFPILIFKHLLHFPAISDVSRVVCSSSKALSRYSFTPLLLFLLIHVFDSSFSLQLLRFTSWTHNWMYAHCRWSGTPIFSCHGLYVVPPHALFWLIVIFFVLILMVGMPLLPMFRILLPMLDKWLKLWNCCNSSWQIIVFVMWSASWCASIKVCSCCIFSQFVISDLLFNLCYLPWHFPCTSNS